MGYMFSKYAEVMLKIAGQDCILQRENKVIRCVFNATESIVFNNYSSVQAENILTISLADLKLYSIDVEDKLLIEDDVFEVDAVLNQRDGFVNLQVKLYRTE